MLNFENLEILFGRLVRRAEMHYRAKFSQNRPIRCGYVAIFRYFKMAAVRHLGFVRGIVGQPMKSTCLVVYIIIKILLRSVYMYANWAHSMGHSGPLCHPLSLLWTSMRRRRGTAIATPGE